MFYMHYLIPFLPFSPSCWHFFQLSYLFFSLLFILRLLGTSSPLLHHITFYITSLTSSSLLFPLLPVLSSALSTFLLYSSPLSSPLFVSPLFSSPVLSSPWPSVYPIWPSHLSWELSQGTRLLIQFLLNLMALSSAFAIPATCGETKQKKMKETEKYKNLSGSPQKLSLDD